MCRKNPQHNNADVIVGKVWLWKILRGCYWVLLPHLLSPTDGN